MTDSVVLSAAGENACIELLGAQLRSCTLSGREVVWPGSQEYWPSSAPLLFPVVGRLEGDRLLAGGREHAHPMHGLARHRTFVVESQMIDRVRLACDHTADGSFPWDWRLEVEYALEDSSLLWTVRVVNPSRLPLPFQLGFHPGVATGGAPANVSWERPCHPVVHGVVPGVGLLNGVEQTWGESTGFPWQDRPTAMVCSGLESASVLLESGVAEVRVTYDPMPDLWVFWAPPGAPFLCPEGWYGRPDREGKTIEFADRPGTRILAGGESFTATCRISLEVQTHGMDRI